MPKVRIVSRNVLNYLESSERGKSLPRSIYMSCRIQIVLFDQAIKNVAVKPNDIKELAPHLEYIFYCSNRTSRNRLVIEHQILISYYTIVLLELRHNTIPPIRAC